MRATGIIRRVDDLGRVMIPKEIRRTLRIREGDPLEIFTDNDGEVILKKYSPLIGIEEYAQTTADVLRKATGEGVLITDRDKVIAVSGISSKLFLDRPLTQNIMDIIDKKAGVNNPERVKPEASAIVDDGTDHKFSDIYVHPVVVDGDSIGSIILVKMGRELTATDMDAVRISGMFMAKQLED